MNYDDMEQVETPAFSKDDYIRELEEQLKAKEEVKLAKTTGFNELDKMVAADKNTTLVETEEGTFILKRAPHSIWLKYFGRIMRFTTKDGETQAELVDFGAAAEFVFKHMLVRPRVSIDDIKDFTVVMALAGEGIAFQMSTGN